MSIFYKQLFKLACPGSIETKGSYPEIKSALIWTLSKEGGLTRIQIVGGTFKEIAIFSAKYFIGVQENRGGGPGFQIEAYFFLRIASLSVPMTVGQSQVEATPNRC